MTTLRDAIRQGKPFDSLEQEAHLALLRTAAEVDHAVAEALKPYDITPTQYNVLRILRGAGGEGLCRNEVRERMIARVPDATRLLDRMESAGLIQRERNSDDRRFVTTRISEAGTSLLAELELPITELHRRHLGHLAPDELRALLRLLERVRAAL